MGAEASDYTYRKIALAFHAVLFPRTLLELG